MNNTAAEFAPPRRGWGGARAAAALFTALAAALGGCAATAPPALPVLGAPPAAFRAAPAVAADHAVAPPASAVVAGGAWWQAFADPVLDELSGRAALSNTGVQGAAARLAQARALLRQAQAGRALQAGVGAGASRQGGPLVNAAGASGSLITAAANVAFDPDLGARLAQAASAAELDVQARAEGLASVRLQVHAEVAQTYFSLRALDAERALARATTEAWRETLRLTQQRWQAGSVAEAAVLRLHTEVAASLAEGLALERRRAESAHALALLLGEPASTFELAEAAWSVTLPAVPAGLPSQMLARRPDVAAALHRLQAAQARRGEARAAWFPSLALTAAGGHASTGLAELLQVSTRAWGWSALLSLPLLDGGRRESVIAQADAVAEVEVAAYRAQVLAAFKEVEDQLGALRLLAEQAGGQAQAGEVAARALALVQSRWRHGLASQLDLLDAQRSVLRQHRLAVQLQAARCQATVGLMRALGGSWGGAG